jgi:hypothetical protein
MKTMKSPGRKRKALRAVLAAFPASLTLARKRSKDKERRIRRVTIETERTLIFRSRTGQRDALCPECGAQRQMLIPPKAAAVAGLSERAIYRLIEAGALHFAEHANGCLLVCGESLEALRHHQ